MNPRHALTIFSSLIVCAALQSGEARQINPQVLLQSEKIRPTDGPTESVLTPASKPLYQIKVVAGDYFVVSVREPLSQVSAVLYRPDGKVQRELQCWHSGRIQISEIAAITGDHVLQLGLCDPEESQVPFTLDLVRGGRGTTAEETRIAAERATTQADGFVKEYREDSYERAQKKYEEALRSWRMVGDRLEEA